MEFYAQINVVPTLLAIHSVPRSTSVALVVFFISKSLIIYEM